MRLTDLCRLIMVLLAFSAGAGSLNSARAETFTCEENCLAAIYDWIVEDVKHYVPLQYAVHERFDGPESKASCSVTRDEKPAVHGVVLAPLYPRFAEYVSTQNDARLLRDFLLERGVRTDFLQVLMGSDVSRPAAIAALGKSLPCVRERDQVVLVMTGDAGNYGKLIAPPLDELGQTLCAGGAPQPVLKDYCRSYKKLPRQAADDISERYRRALTDHDEAIFFTSEVRFNAEQRRKDRKASIVGIGAFEISNYVAQVRNRGADAIVVIDASYAASFYLDNLQRRSTPDGSWFWNSYATPEPPDTMVEEILVPLFGTGHFAAFYAAADNQIAGAVTDTERSEKLSYLVLAFTEVLREKAGAPLTELAKDITKSMKRRGAGQDPIFAASSTGVRLLSTVAADAPPSDLIEILSPSLKRGASFVEEKCFTLVGRYTGAAKAARAIVDGEIVPVDGNGQFRRDITDTAGKLSIAIRVLSPDFETLAVSDIKLKEPEDAPIIPASARKIALVIANQNYAGTESFPALKTPFSDAEQVAKILRDRYGFTTVLEGGRTLDLFLKDASKAQIQETLFQLRQRLTPEDQLIVYYAGHGENDPDLGAFWVPADGQPKADFTWIAAEEITRELKRMNAGSILVISDSCYAGGLSRGGETDAPQEARERYLAKAARLKARQLMASGGEEPVEDGGGGGHSIFARALIDALHSMPDETFTASELFEQKVKPAVISAANAVSEGQTPGFSRIARAGDEPGSEFVFQRVK